MRGLSHRVSRQLLQRTAARTSLPRRRARLAPEKQQLYSVSRPLRALLFGFRSFSVRSRSFYRASIALLFIDDLRSSTRVEGVDDR